MPIRSVLTYMGLKSSDLNEVRADRGVCALRAASRRTDPIVASVEDTLAYLAHACDRFGLAPAQTFREGLKRYRQNLEDAPASGRVADGLTTTLEEVYDHDDNDDRRSN